jgi:hypothetical protein
MASINKHATVRYYLALDESEIKVLFKKLDDQDLDMDDNKILDEILDTLRGYGLDETTINL